MKKLFPIVVASAALFSCNAQSSQKNKNYNSTKRTAAMVEGKDYVIVKRFRVEDKQGFDNPVEVSSFVLPASWQVNSNVQWNLQSKCLPEIVQVSVNAKSKDCDYELTFYPATQFDWSMDAVQLDAMRRGFYPVVCNLAKPQDAAGYIQNTLATGINAQVKSAKVIPELQQLMDAGALQQTQLARQGGNNAYNHRGSAAEGVLQFADGKEGLVFCTLMQTIVTIPGTQGGMASNIQCYIGMRIVLKYKSGNEAMARKIMSTFFSSTKLNPTWFNAITNFFIAKGKNIQDQNWKHIQEIRAVQEQQGNNIIRNWEQKNDASIAAFSKNSDGFGQYLRGVENYKDENGNTVELTSGYGNAWSKSDGTYLLTTNPAFDPNVEMGDTQNWKRLNK
ncbi:MAG: hypothetical protein RLZZ316_2 [Bacteroidota bacterium]